MQYNMSYYIAFEKLFAGRKTMIGELFAGAFPIFRQVEGYPVCTILSRELSNDPFKSPIRSNTPYETVIERVECVFSRSDARTDLGDNVVNTNTSFYFLERLDPLERDNGDLTCLSDLIIGVRHLILYDGQLYKPTTGGTTNDFGLIEVRVSLGN